MSSHTIRLMFRFHVIGVVLIELSKHMENRVSNKKLLGAPGIATRSKDATRGSWSY